MQFTDALTLDAPRKTSNGYMVVRARAARTGVYDYAGRELDPENKHGLRDQAVVKVLRDEATVFDKAAVQSFIGKPITDDHPAEAVTAANWRDHARGTVMGALKDGEYLAFDLLLTDAATIAKVDSGKRELSNGYAADIEFGDFAAPDGTKCQARQAKITDGNHVALVKFGRAGSECRIADAAPCDSLPLSNFLTDGERTVKKFMLDGLQVDLTDADAVTAAFTKLQDKATAAEKALADANTAHDKAMGAKDAEIEGLKAKVVDQAQIDALADQKAEVVAKAKSVLGDKLPDMKGKSIADVRRVAVALKCGDAAVADKSDDYVEARFDGLTADAKPTDAVRELYKDGGVSNVNDNAAVRNFARAAQY